MKYYYLLFNGLNSKQIVQTRCNNQTLIAYIFFLKPELSDLLIDVS